MRINRRIVIKQSKLKRLNVDWHKMQINYFCFIFFFIEYLSNTLLKFRDQATSPINKLKISSH